MKFFRKFDNFTIENEIHLTILEVKSHGNSIEELIQNASLHIEDWNGDAGPYRTMNDLDLRDIKRITSEMLDDLTNYLAEYYSRGH